jgi:hypothetical protein
MTGYQLSASVSTCFGPGLDAGLAVANKRWFDRRDNKHMTFQNLLRYDPAAKAKNLEVFCRLRSAGRRVHSFGVFLEKQKMQR